MDGEERCLYTLIPAPRERHDRILTALVAPVVRAIDGHPDLHSLFFARYNKPDWQLRFRVLGRPAWIDQTVRPLLEERLAAHRAEGLFDEYEFAEYDREWERYGGPVGMRLSEKLFWHDSVFALGIVSAGSGGQLEKSRREIALVMSERYLDLFGLSREQRIEVYRFGYTWELELGRWDDEALAILERKYAELEPGLLSLFAGEQSRDAERRWGGTEPARLAAEFLRRAEPVTAAMRARHAAGEIPQELSSLVWSLTHMHCNRLQVEADAEAMIRYFMFRLHQDHPGLTGPAGG